MFRNGDVVYRMKKSIWSDIKYTVFNKYLDVHNRTNYEVSYLDFYGKLSHTFIQEKYLESEKQRTIRHRKLKLKKIYEV